MRSTEVHGGDGKTNATLTKWCSTDDVIDDVTDSHRLFRD